MRPVKGEEFVDVDVGEAVAVGDKKGVSLDVGLDIDVAPAPTA